MDNNNTKEPNAAGGAAELKTSEIRNHPMTGNGSRSSPFTLMEDFTEETTTTSGNHVESTKRPLTEEILPMPKRARLEDQAAVTSSSHSEPASGHSEHSSPLFSDDSSSPTKTREQQELGDLKQPSNHNDVLQSAKARLSKWAARLFDPDRPRGLIEGPQIIPLNDDFLKAFGQREKAYDAAVGKDMDIDHAIEDDDYDQNHMDVEGQFEDATSPTSAAMKSKKRLCKVKINNLKFTTTAAKLLAACQKFGPVENVKLVMDDDKKDSKLNRGRAYVNFEDPISAEACIAGLKEVDGRSLTVSLAAEVATPFAKSASESRYWIKDISTKCYRCGQVGHMEADCVNEPVARPCPLCATAGHEIRNCPKKAVCFNCGVPGHVSRECRQQRGMPKRRIDDAAVSRSTAEAVCMECHQRGHYLCREFKWFVGLTGNLSCYNCGQRNHVGHYCARPNAEVCSRSESVLEQEIARAATFTSDDLIIVSDRLNEVPSRGEATRRRDTIDAPRNSSTYGSLQSYGALEAGRSRGTAEPVSQHGRNSGTARGSGAAESFRQQSGGERGSRGSERGRGEGKSNERGRNEGKSNERGRGEGKSNERGRNEGKSNERGRGEGKSNERGRNEGRWGRENDSNERRRDSSERKFDEDARRAKSLPPQRHRSR